VATDIGKPSRLTKKRTEKWNSYKGKSHKERSTMKITKVQLKQIIKEELDAVLSETNESPKVDIDLSKVFDAVVSGIDMADSPDFSDAYIESAEYEYAPGQYRNLTQEEIIYLNEDEKFDEWVWKQVWEQVN